MPGRGSVESLNQTEATNAAVTLVQACAELRDNLSALAASRAMLAAIIHEPEAAPG